MRDEQVGDAGSLLDLHEQVEHARLGGQVERGHRLVAHDQFWLQRERSGDGDALALAAGELAGSSLNGIGR